MKDEEFWKRFNKLANEGTKALTDYILRKNWR